MTSLEWARRQGEDLIGQHLDGWVFGFDHARARVGCCDHRRRRITLSRHLVAHLSQGEVDQSLRHEIAHAVVGPQAGHGPIWQSTAAQLGYVGGRTVAVPQARLEARWLARCRCGQEYRRHRRPSSTAYCQPCARAGQWHALRWVDQRR